MKLELKPYVLNLKHPFTISRESHEQQETLIACLSEGGKTGYGEATSNPYYKISIEGMQEEIEKVRADIELYSLDTPGEFHTFRKKGLVISPFAHWTRRLTTSTEKYSGNPCMRYGEPVFKSTR